MILNRLAIVRDAGLTLMENTNKRMHKIVTLCIERMNALKKIVLHINDQDRVSLDAEGFLDTLDDLEEIFHILASGASMVATKIEQMKKDDIK